MRPPRTAPRRLLVVLAAWTSLGVFELSKDYVQGLANLGRVPTRVDVVMTMESLWLWAAFTPLIFALAERFPLERGRIAGRLALHALFAVGLAAADVLVDHAVAPLAGPEAVRPLLRRFLGESFINLYSYAAVLGVGLALRYHRLALERQTRIARLETELVEANLEALERQLRPHFLYNTLHTIASLVRAQRGPEAVRVIAMLGNLLRHALRSRGEHEVTLAREVDFARRYLAIEEVRFQGRLRVRLDVDDDTLAAKVPHFLLQPIVENAVRHGVEPSSKEGRVTVTAARDGDVLRIDVTDSGGGCARGAHGDGRGIGLGNTRARLAQMYGDAQHLELATGEAAGTVVRIAIPFRSSIEGASA